jgi:hypothetical protein
MTRRKKIVAAATVVIAPTALLFAYVRTRPSVRGVALQAALPARLSLPSWQNFPGLTAVLEDYVGCEPATCSAATPNQTQVISIQDNGLQSDHMYQPIAPGQLIEREGIINGIGFRVSIFPAGKIKTTWPIPGNNLRSLMAGRADPTKDCKQTVGGNPTFASGVEFVGIEDIVATDARVNYRAAKFHARAPSTISYLWLVPDLGCFQIRMEQQSKGTNRDASQNLQSTYQITRSVVLGSPAADKFAMAPDLIETKPSDWARISWIEKAKARGVTQAEAEAKWPNIAAAKGAAHLDTLYATVRIKAGWQ